MYHLRSASIPHQHLTVDTFMYYIMDNIMERSVDILQIF